MISLLDTNGYGALWTPANGPGRTGNHEQQRYTPDAISTLAGVQIVVGLDSEGFYSGELDSPFQYGPGAYTARLRMPKTPAAGIWPAFWMVNNHGANPPQEIDVVEWLGSDPTKIRCNYIWNYTTGLAGQTTSTIDLGVDLSADFHDYAVTWTPQALRWWVDGRLVKQFTAADAQAAGTVLPAALMRLIVNCAVGSSQSLGGAPTPATLLPATFSVAGVTAQ